MFYSLVRFYMVFCNVNADIFFVFFIFYDQVDINLNVSDVELILLVYFYGTLIF